jgi:hypothetical protein
MAAPATCSRAAIPPSSWMPTRTCSNWRARLCSIRFAPAWPAIRANGDGAAIGP